MAVASATPPRDYEPRSTEDITYAAERFRQCYAILDAARAEREMREQLIRRAPRRAPVPGRDWCYRCARGPHLITEADHRPVWPLQPSLNGAPAMPLDNWITAQGRRDERVEEGSREAATDHQVQPQAEARRGGRSAKRGRRNERWL